MSRTSSILFWVVLLATIIFLCTLPKWYLKNPGYKLESKMTERLTQLGDSALHTFDVPVAAVLLYNNNIIGEGYNTVNRDRQAGGHAEINAISDAMRKTGVDSFMKLDRRQLMLITTLEPCYMCRGAVVEYNIEHVVIVKPKSLYHWFKQWRKIEKYEWNKQAATTDSLQDVLFRKHPQFSKLNVKNDF